MRQRKTSTRKNFKIDGDNFKVVILSDYWFCLEQNVQHRMLVGLLINFILTFFSKNQTHTLKCSSYFLTLNEASDVKTKQKALPSDNFLL